MSALTNGALRHSFDSFDDRVLLSGRYHRAARPEGEPPRAILLLVHGLGEYAGRYDDFISSIVAEGIDVYDYDQRGHGDSPGRRALVNVMQLVRDATRVRNLLRREVGAGIPMYIFGHSLGGLVVAESVRKRPEEVAGVILSSPALKIDTGHHRAELAFLRGLSYLWPTCPVSAISADELTTLPEVNQSYRDDPMVFRGRVPARTASSMMHISRRTLSMAGAWERPLLVVQGANDAIVDPAGAQQFAENAGSFNAERPEVTYHQVAGAKHETLNDVSKDEVQQVILEFLRNRLAVDTARG